MENTNYKNYDIDEINLVEITSKDIVAQLSVHDQLYYYPERLLNRLLWKSLVVYQWDLKESHK